MPRRQRKQVQRRRSNSGGYDVMKSTGKMMVGGMGLMMTAGAMGAMSSAFSDLKK